MTWKADSNSHPEASLFDDLFSLFYGYGLDFGTYRSMMACKSTEEPFPLAAPYETPSTRGGVRVFSGTLHAATGNISAKRLPITTDFLTIRPGSVLPSK